MSLSVGGAEIGGVYVGATPVSGVYVGSTKIWPTGAPSDWATLASSTWKALSTTNLSMPVAVEAGDLLVLLGCGSSSLHIGQISDSQGNSYTAEKSVSTRRNRLQIRYAVAKATGTNTYSGQWYNVGTVGQVGVLVFKASAAVSLATESTKDDGNFVAGTTLRSLPYSTAAHSILIGMFDADGDTHPPALSDSDFVQDFAATGYTVFHAIKNAAVSETLQYNFPGAGSVWTFGLIYPLIGA